MAPVLTNQPQVTVAMTGTYRLNAMIARVRDPCTSVIYANSGTMNNAWLGWHLQHAVSAQGGLRRRPR